jgi:hypothetical protein
MIIFISIHLNSLLKYHLSILKQNCFIFNRFSKLSKLIFFENSLKLSTSQLIFIFNFHMFQLSFFLLFIFYFSSCIGCFLSFRLSSYQIINLLFDLYNLVFIRVQKQIYNSRSISSITSI